MIGYAQLAISAGNGLYLVFIVHILRFSDFDEAFAHYEISCIHSAS